MFEVEYTESRDGEMQTFVRRHSSKAAANDFYDAMRRTGTPSHRIRKNYDEPCISERIPKT
jgi:hypothetical protein